MDRGAWRETMGSQRTGNNGATNTHIRLRTFELKGYLFVLTTVLPF